MTTTTDSERQTGEVNSRNGIISTPTFVSLTLQRIFAPHPEPTNGGGRTFSDKNFTVTVYGSFTLDDTLEDFWKQTLEKYGDSISFKVRKKN